MQRSRVGVIGRRTLLATTGGLLATPAIVRAQGQNGVALVIGNSKYQWEAQLPNVKRDAPDIAKTFQAMGLKTELVQDAGQSAMQEAIDKFAATAKDAAFAAFYFAGHGTQWKNQPFLVPVNADLSVPKTDGLVSTELANKACNGARANIRIYDNCRNNPADGWKQKEAEDNSLIRGTTRVSFAQKNPNSLVLFSTAPGRAALDGPAGQNSPFAAAVLRQFDAATVDLSTLAAKVRRDVMMATRGRQIVVDFSGYDQPLSVKGARLGRQAAAAGDSTGMIELPKAYAYMAQNKIPVPPGLAAFRSSDGADLQKKVGSFKYTARWPNSGDSNEILIVLAVDPEGTPEFILGGSYNNGWWRFVKGRNEGDQIEFLAYDGPAAPVQLFKWRTADSGVMDASWPKSARPPKPVGFAFERLDG